ncbi:MAG: Hsp20/alpha crystallin family protein [Anaerolineae bacterium]|jgi:HSP20 family protein
MSNIMRREPFRDLVSLREAMNRLFEESFVEPGRTLARARRQPVAVDMYETKDDVVVKATLPGIKAEDLDISVTGDVLSIRGEIGREEEIEEGNYICRERFCGTFGRSLSLPTQVVAEEAEAEFENGVLVLTLPKAEAVKPREIKVKAK